MAAQESTIEQQISTKNALAGLDALNKMEQIAKRPPTITSAFWNDEGEAMACVLDAAGTNKTYKNRILTWILS